MKEARHTRSHVVWFYEVPRTGKVPDKSRWVAVGARVGTMENDCLAGTWFLTGARKIFQSLMVVMAAQHQECTKSHWAARGILLQCKKKKRRQLSLYWYWKHSKILYLVKKARHGIVNDMISLKRGATGQGRLYIQAFLANILTNIIRYCFWWTVSGEENLMAGRYKETSFSK